MISRSALEPHLKKEMAGDEATRLSFGAYEEDPHPSEILATRSRPDHRLGELYEEMYRKDGDLKGLQRKLDDSVLDLSRSVVAHDERRRAVEVRDLCDAALDGIDNLDDRLRHQLGAEPRGVAVDEIIWEEIPRGPHRGAWLPVDIISRPMWRFAFNKRRLGVRRVDGPPIPAPIGKFLVSRRGSNDSPWGDPLLDYLYWPWYIKLHGIHFWSLNLEQWTSPFPIGRWKRFTGDDAEDKNDDMEKQALELARAVWGGGAASAPDDVLLDLIEAKRSGNVSYADFCAAQTRKMALVLQGEINTSGLRPGVGVYASEAISQEIRQEKRNLKAVGLVAHLRKTLLRWIVTLNYGPDEPCPPYVIDVLAAEEQETLLKGIEAAFAANAHLQEPIRIPRSHLHRAWRIPAPVGGEAYVTEGFPERINHG